MEGPGLENPGRTTHIGGPDAIGGEKGVQDQPRGVLRQVGLDDLLAGGQGEKKRKAAEDGFHLKSREFQNLNR